MPISAIIKLDVAAFLSTSFKPCSLFKSGKAGSFSLAVEQGLVGMRSCTSFTCLLVPTLQRPRSDLSLVMFVDCSFWCIDVVNLFEIRRLSG